MPENTIPTINFSEILSNLKAGSPSWNSVSNQIRQALEEYGCFEAIFPQVSPQLHEKVFSLSKALFELPLETKRKITSEEPYRGYIPPNPLMPLYESLAIDYATSIQNTHKFLDLLWPAGKDNFCEDVHSYAVLLAELEEMVLQMLFESYGVRKHNFTSVAASNSHLLRFIKYKEPEDEQTKIRFAPHTDKNFVTIVAQHEVGGLEVHTKQDLWLGIEPSPSRFLFLAGDGLQVWSNDRIKACNHRVKDHGKGERYSLLLTTFNNGVIQVPDELVDDKHPLLYNPFDSRGFMRFFIAEARKLKCDPIKAYCGINKDI
ncbi:hypothetical protein UlMin_000926 [Ulmus minor]